MGTPAPHGRLGRITRAGIAASTTTAAICLGGGSPQVPGLGLGAAAAAERAGPAEIVAPSNGAPLDTGASGTAFRMKLPAGSACKGDSAKAGYRVQSYLVPQSIDPGTLAFDPGVGPVPVAGEFRAPMYEVTSSSFVDQQTATAERPGGPGPIIQPLPPFSFAVFDPALGFPFTPGVYNVGVACTLGPPTSASQHEKYWNRVLTVTADPSDPGPAKIRWVVTAPPPGITPSRSAGPWVAVATGAAVLAGIGFVVRRRRAERHPASRPALPTTLKETR